MNVPARLSNAVTPAVRTSIGQVQRHEHSGGYGDARHWGGRALGLIGTLLVYALGIAMFLVSWTDRRPSPPPKNISIFNVAPPAAPPQPPSEVPAGPQQVQQETSEPVQHVPRNELPAPVVAARSLPAAIPQPTPDAAPLVPETRAPESKPVPPAAVPSDGKPSWEGRILAALNKVKRYPREAMFRRQQGVPYIRFTLDREGKVMSVILERPSGVKALDAEALALPKRAQPLPKPPAEVHGTAIELVVPVEFFLR